MNARTAAIIYHPLYQQGYSEGYKRGLNEMYERCQELILRAEPREIHIKCEDFADCPYKKEAKECLLK